MGSLRICDRGLGACCDFSSGVAEGASDFGCGSGFVDGGGSVVRCSAD
jgi:hypothetical protein